MLVYSVHVGRNGRARARTGLPPILSTVERSPQRRRCAARAGVAPWEHREAMWADRFSVHCPNPQNAAGQRRNRRWSTGQFMVTPPPFTSQSPAEHMPITCQSHANITSITCQSRPNHTCHEEGVVSPCTGCLKKHILQQFCSRRCPNASNILIGRQNIFSQKCFFGPTAGGGWVLAWDHLGVTSASSRDHLLATAWHGFWGCYGFYGFYGFYGSYGFYAVRGICGSHLPQNPGPGSGSPEKKLLAAGESIGLIWTPPAAEWSQKMFLGQSAAQVSSKLLQSLFKACPKLVQSFSKAPSPPPPLRQGSRVCDPVS